MAPLAAKTAKKIEDKRIEALVPSKIRADVLGDAFDICDHDGNVTTYELQKALKDQHPEFAKLFGADFGSEAQVMAFFDSIDEDSNAVTKAEFMDHYHVQFYASNSGPVEPGRPPPSAADIDTLASLKLGNSAKKGKKISSAKEIAVAIAPFIGISAEEAAAMQPKEVLEAAGKHSRVETSAVAKPNSTPVKGAGNGDARQKLVEVSKEILSQ